MLVSLDGLVQRLSLQIGADQADKMFGFVYIHTECHGLILWQNINSLQIVIKFLLWAYEIAIRSLALLEMAVRGAVDQLCRARRHRGHHHLVQAATAR